MTKEKLEQLGAKELAALCKERGIPHHHGKNRFRKDEMVTAILKAESAEDSHSGNTSAEDKTKIGDRTNKGAEAETKQVKGKKSASGYVVNMERKMPYIENATVGTLVAFRLPNGKVKSAMIIKKSTKNRRFMLETEYGAQYVVDYTDIVWVRTLKRWPRGVYKLLKGLGDDGKAAG